ncbi:MAG: hypothetical protein KDC44_03815 [Phaeodactylibacter sp.]|nr:hypothetical protein [Phaeodactylibacter sp.]
MKQLCAPLLLLLLLCSIPPEAQCQQYRAFHEINYQFAYGVLPEWRDVISSRRRDMLLDVGIGYHFRYNVYEMGDNGAIGLNLAPYVGAFYTVLDEGNRTGFLGANSIVGLSYQSGAGSTYNTSKNFGLALMGGMEFSLFPLTGDNGLTHFYSAPFAETKLHYWRNNRLALMNFFVRYTFVRHNPETADAFVYKPFLIRVGFGYSLGY